MCVSADHDRRIDYVRVDGEQLRVAWVGASRSADHTNALRPLLICNEDHRFIVAEQMRQIGVEPRSGPGRAVNA